MRTSVGAALALALACALPVHADAAASLTCSFTDPAGDVTINGTTATFASDHVDLRTIDVTVGPKTLTVVFHNTAGNDKRLGVWRLTFKSGPTVLYTVASLGDWVGLNEPDGEPGFRGGVLGHPAKNGSGVVTADGTVRVTVPLTIFGAAAPRRGTVLSGFSATSRENLASADDGSYDLGIVDRAASPLRMTVGGACRP